MASWWQFSFRTLFWASTTLISQNFLHGNKNGAFDLIFYKLSEKVIFVEFEQGEQGFWFLNRDFQSKIWKPWTTLKRKPWFHGNESCVKRFISGQAFKKNFPCMDSEKSKMFFAREHKCPPPPPPISPAKWRSYRKWRPTNGDQPTGKSRNFRNFQVLMSFALGCSYCWAGQHEPSSFRPRHRKHPSFSFFFVFSEVVGLADKIDQYLAYGGLCTS